MSPPLLARSTARSAVSFKPAPQSIPTNEEWAQLQPEIERLYVRERRKLRHVMVYMEKEYGFKATYSTQMYKKRLAKWDVRKNSKRYCNSTTSSPSSTTLSSTTTPAADLALVPAILRLDYDDALMFTFLTDVQTWNSSFYETLQTQTPSPCSDQRLAAVGGEEMNFMFKLVINMLNRGHGSLAGRLARKAFLLVEEALMLDGPALVWNLLEILHYMVETKHLQLFRMLLAHLTALIDGRLPTSHPLSSMLRTLRATIANTAKSNLLCDIPSSPSTSPSPQSDDSGEEKAIARMSASSDALSSMMERAWTLNAEILFNRFDHRLFQLYFRIHWDSCSLEPPRAIFDATNQWLDAITSQRISENVTQVDQAVDFFPIAPLEKDRMIQRIFATPSDVSLPENYELLQSSTFEALRNHAESLLNENVAFTGHNTMLMRVLASLVTTKVLEEWSNLTSSTPSATDIPWKVPRGYASNVACALRTLIELDAKSGHNQLETSEDNINRIRSIAALQEYAHDSTHPRVIQELWLLERALIAAGEYDEASEVNQTAYRRLEKHVQNIPVDSA